MATPDGDRIKNFKPQLYADKLMLAPMVRENNLPFRLMCLKYGADIVYTEELIDYRLCECRRLENKVLGTIDFVDEKGEVFLRTCPSEKDKLILQIGSNDPVRALKAAQLCSQDIAGLDFNFGCPKSFSLSGGMGAALLEKPDQIKSLLTMTVDNLDIPVTCKIRILPDTKKTIDLVKMIEGCGVSAIAVHGRTKDQRPRHDNQTDVLREVAQTLTIPMIANGGSNHIKCYSDILKFREATKASSVMIARVAMKNPSIFQPNNVTEPIEKIVREYLKLAVKYDNYIGTTKYTIQAMLGSGHFGQDLIEKFHQAGDFKTLCDIFNLSDWYEINKLTRSKDDFYDKTQLDDDQLRAYISEKKASLEQRGIEFYCDNVPYVPRVYGSQNSPKSQLINHFNKMHSKLPEFEVFQLANQDHSVNKSGRYYCTVTHENVCYLNKTYTNGKRLAEQATAMIVCERLKLVDLGEYKKRTNASNKNVF